MFAKKKAGLYKANNKADGYLSIDPKDINLYRYVDAESIMYKLGFEIRDFPKELIEAHPRTTIRYAKDYMYKFLNPDPLDIDTKTLRRETDKDLRRLNKLANDIKDPDQKRYLSEFDSILKNSGLRLANRTRDEEKNKKIIRNAWKKEADKIAENRANAQATVGQISNWPSRLGFGVLGGIATKLAINALPENIPLLGDIDLKAEENMISLGVGTLFVMVSGRVIDRYSQYKDKIAERKYTEQLTEEDHHQADYKRAIIVQTFAEIGNMGHDVLPDNFYKFEYKTKEEISREIKKYKNKYGKYSK